MKKRSSDRQRIRHVFSAVASGIEDSSAIIIAEAVRRTGLR